MTFEEIVIKFLEYAESEWPRRRTNPEQFYNCFATWFDWFKGSPQQSQSQNSHDCQLCELLALHFNDEDLPLVFLQIVEARRYVEEDPASSHWILVPAEDLLLKDLRNCLENKDISSWSADSGAWGIFPPAGNPGVADVRWVVAIVVPLTQTLSKPGIYPANFMPDNDCQAALRRALEASRYIVSSRRTFWPAIWFILAGDWFPWSLLRVVLRGIKYAQSARQGNLRSWEKLLQNSKVYIAVTGARMGQIIGPSIALVACMAIWDALRRIPKAQRPPVLPLRIEQLTNDTVQQRNRAFTGNLTGIGELQPVGNIEEKLDGVHSHKEIREIVLPEENFPEAMGELARRSVNIESSNHSPRRCFRIQAQGREHLGFADLNILLDKLAPVWNWQWTILNLMIIGIVIASIIVLPPYFYPPIPVITGGTIRPVNMGPVEIRIIGYHLFADGVPINSWTQVALQIERNGYKGPLFIEVSSNHGKVNSEFLDFGKASERVQVTGKEATFFYNLLDTIDSIGLNLLNEEEKSVKLRFLIVVGKRSD